MISIRRFGWLALALFALAGCESATPPATTPTTPQKEADSGKLSDDEVAEIKKLPEAEQSAALAQLSCPSSGEHLGKMGTPIKQTIGDKSFYICCKGCEDEVKSDPKGILAKLKK
jgi:hypothetical protein